MLPCGLDIQDINLNRLQSNSHLSKLSNEPSFVKIGKTLILTPFYPSGTIIPQGCVGGGRGYPLCFTDVIHKSNYGMRNGIACVYA